MNLVLPPNVHENLTISASQGTALRDTPAPDNGVLSVVAYLKTFGTRLKDVFTFPILEPLISRRLSVRNQKRYSFLSQSLWKKHSCSSRYPNLRAS